MKKLLILAVSGGLLLAACSPGGGAAAATVDGTDITVGEVEDLIFSDSGTITKEQFAEFLSFRIQWNILERAASADFGFAATEQEIEDEAQRIFEAVPDKPEGQTMEEFLEERSVTEEFLNNLARQGLTDLFLRDAFAEDAPDPAAEEIDAARNEARATVTQVCASHILVGTSDEAQDVRDRLDSGEEFGVIAQEVSTDTGSGANNGVLPCTVASDYVPTFRDAVMVAPVGEVYEETVESNFGFHIVMVTDRQDPADGDLPDDSQLTETIKNQWVADELLAWFNDVMASAVVTVDPEYGTWQPNPPTVIPPQG